MSIFRRKPRRDAKFVYVALDGETHKAHLWPGDTFEIWSEDKPALKIAHKDGAWHIEQLTPLMTMDDGLIAWAARQPTTTARR